MTVELDRKIAEAQAEYRKLLEARYSKGGAFLAHSFMVDVEAPELEKQHLAESKIVPTRSHILPFLPKNCVFVEVGTQTGSFAKEVMINLEPKQLHVIDVDYSYFDQTWAENYLAKGQLIKHEGDSSTILSQFEDQYFDVIYIDADHSYSGIKKDLAQAGLKVKPDGWIVCNDYTCWSPLEVSKYGVYRAVNEFCLTQDWGIRFLALHRWGYHDVALRRIG